MPKKKKIPTWAKVKRARRGELVGDGGARQVVWTPADVVALIDRVNARYRSLALSVASTPTDPDPLGVPWREAWAGQYRAWLDFAEAGRGVWGSAWGSTATSAQAFDRELDAFVAAFEARTGTETGIPDSDDSGQDAELGPLVQVSTGAGVGFGLVVLGGLFLAWRALR